MKPKLHEKERKRERTRGKKEERIECSKGSVIKVTNTSVRLGKPDTQVGKKERKT